MHRREALTALLIALVVGLAVAPAAVAKPDEQIGARTLGDPSCRSSATAATTSTITASPSTTTRSPNGFNSARTTISASATQKLKEFSLDFQETRRLERGGRRARGRLQPGRGDARSERRPVVTQPMKLVVKPDPSARPKAGRTSRSGPLLGAAPGDHRPGHLHRRLDPGLLPAQPAADLRRRLRGQRADGAQSWFPSNNYPTDKAKFDTVITVPAAKTAFGVGELAARPTTATAPRRGIGPRTIRPRPI